MNILVTGAAGFISSQLSYRLYKEGHNDVIITSFDENFYNYLAQVEYDKEQIYNEIKQKLSDLEVQEDESRTKLFSLDQEIKFQVVLKDGQIQFLTIIII